MTGPAHLIALTAAFVAVLSAARGEAHKPITSPYSYNEDVFPILRDRCGRCHVPGGVAPMSLMTYKDAFPWGESIRTELIAGHMPPGRTNQAAGTFKNTHELSARELNILLVWLTGGNPMGNVERTRRPFRSNTTGRSARRISSSRCRRRSPSQAKRPKTRRSSRCRRTPPNRAGCRAVNLLPGTPAMVRSATVSVKSGVPAASTPGRAASADRASSAETPESVAVERVLAVWSPDDSPIPLDGGRAFQLPPNAELVLRVHYKKTWENERLAMTDRSSVGLYFAPAPATALRALTVTPTDEVRQALVSSRTSVDSANGNQPASVSFSRTVDEDLEAVALYFDGALANANVAVQAERPDGTRSQLIRFRPQADWATRYWLAAPVPLPRGTRITVAATFTDVLLPPGASPLASKRPDASAFRVTVNVVGK